MHMIGTVATTMTAILMDCFGGSTKFGSIRLMSLAEDSAVTMMFRRISCRGYILSSFR